MIAWLSENLVNIVIIAILVLVVELLIRGMIRDKKAGKSSCGGNCASCGACSHVIQNDKETNLIRTRVSVDGMMCGMCEAHVNDAVRKAIPVKKVSSSHTKGETLIITEGRPNEELLRRAINETGYTVVSVESQPFVQKQKLRPDFG